MAVMLLLFFPLTIERHIFFGNLFDQLRQFQSAAAADSRSRPLPSSDSPPWLRGDTRSFSSGHDASLRVYLKDLDGKKTG